jgi:GDP-4-dehydro-6-deoxy-D-mannose reductase
MRVLITGASGFAGGYLAQACAEAGDEVLGVSRTGSLPSNAGEGRALDLRDGNAVHSLLRSFKPEVIYHLAALSSVGKSWEQPERTMQDNVASAASLLEALRLELPSARTVWVSSCEVYGAPAQLPVPEDAPQRPANPYAVSKSAADMLAGVYADAYGLDLIRARPFNHTGPGQRPIFIVSSLTHQAAQARLEGQSRLRIVTGNPETRRDFTDVRDVVRAYRLLAEKAEPGIYNVSSAHSISAAEHVHLIGELLAPIEVEHVVDPARVRAHEVMDLRGANDRLTAATGWRPEIPFRQTVHDMIDWWERELAREPAKPRP